MLPNLEEEVWIISSLGETSRTNLEGNPCVAATSILPFASWRDMATTWRDELDDVVPRPGEAGNNRSTDSKDKFCKRKDRRKDTRSERRGKRRKSLDLARERDAKANRGALRQLLAV